MANIQYHTVESETANATNSFSEFNTADFILTGPGRKYLKNSLRLEGTIVVKKNNVEKVLVDDFRLDNMIGFHAMIESISTDIQSVSQIENLNQYPVYAKMQASSGMNAEDFCRADYIAEGRGPVDANGRYVLEAVAASNKQATGAAAVQTSEAPFCLKPNMCLNRMTGGDYSFDKYGYIRVSMNFARSNHFMFGQDCDGTMSYEVKNLKLRYTSVPEDNKDVKILMNSYVAIKSTMNSQNGSFQARVPSDAVLGCAISFLRQSDESSAKENTYQLQKLPGISSIKFLFSDTQNRFISYTIDELSDMMDRGVRSLRYAGHSSAQPDTLKGNEGMIVGTPFNQVASLRNQKFTTLIETDNADLSSRPFIVRQFFHTLLSI